MASLNEFLQNFVNEDYSTLVGMAQAAIVKVKPVFDKIAKDGNGNSAIIALFATSLAVDGKLSDLEYKFVCDVFQNDFSRDEVKALVQGHYSDDMVNAIDGLVDSCPTDLKSALITLCCCFLCADEHINRDEVAFVVKLIEA